MKLKSYLDELVARYNHTDFIQRDPVSIPHNYSIRQDIEISGFWTAILSWGQRPTIINKSNQLFSLMDNAPYDFIVNHEESDRKRFLTFKHRTFQPSDTLYFLHFLQSYYRNHHTMEDLFIPGKDGMKDSLIRFKTYFFRSGEHLRRTEKHISTPSNNSSCKRLNMFLRWMVRKDHRGVDFGLWNRINPRSLMIPLDVHVFRVSRKLGILNRKIPDWKAVEELTSNLRRFDPEDPVKYDYALFASGVNRKLSD